MAYQEKNYETALIHFFPALDKVAKRRRPKDGVGARIRSFLKDEEVLISAIATGNIFRGFSLDDITFEEAIYKFGRTSIAHEGELDYRLTFIDGGSWSIGKVWQLPSTYILALCVAVITAPECKDESIDMAEAFIHLFGKRWHLNDLWGAETAVKAHIAHVFKNTELFI